MLIAVAATLVGASAQAAPITYLFSAGQVTITGEVGGNPVAGPVVIPLTGSAVQVDESALSLNYIILTIGTTGSIAIAPPYLGFTSINIDSATLSVFGGSISLFDPGPPQGYNYSVGPVNVVGQFDAVNLIPANDINDAPFGFSNPSASGTFYVDTMAALPYIALDGITIGSIDPDGPGGVDPLVLKGDFIFEGVIPEPGTAMLLALGLAGIAARQRRS